MININFFKTSILVLLLSIFSFVFPNLVIGQESKFYNANLLYDKGKIELKDIAVLPGEISQIPQEGEYKFELISFAGTILYTNHFNVPLSIHGEEIDPTTGQFISKTIKTDNVEFILNIPYFPIGKSINIYDSKNINVLEIPVIGFAQVTPTPIKKSPFNNPNLIIFLAPILGGIAIFAAIVIFKRHKKPQNPIQ